MGSRRSLAPRGRGSQVAVCSVRQAVSERDQRRGLGATVADLARVHQGVGSELAGSGRLTGNEQDRRVRVLHLREQLLRRPERQRPLEPLRALERIADEEPEQPL
jgi:hypothetical protein